MLRFWLTFSSLTTALIILAVLGFLLQASWPLLQDQGLGFVSEAEWYPYEQLYGLLPVLVGSFWSVVLALLLAVPTGLAAAILCAELLPERGRAALRFSMELMAGIPSVVYGLLGLWLLLPLLERQLDLLTGRSLLAAGLLLALMILPTMMVFSETALRAVVTEQRETALLLGLDWPTRVTRLLLPQAWPGIRVAILLALGRAMGETVAVMLVVGSLDRLPQPLYNLLQPAQTLTSRIGREMAEAVVGSVHWAALIASGLTLALVAMVLSLLTQGWRRQ
ncbi:MAG TPA: phosphate ABC transporter permease subunit PstC [Candidatus Tenderia electrophaga]|uniref:Phosphate transport system permease protein n=1 Tax=Candidatus Tenderia electrophaga TaxID=1748243 RepID=A0A832N3A0_9GAMM|nr:phosphate ABC transporter permease subunit PstC [Candidatus Tenderia electrophaga]